MRFLTLLAAIILSAALLSSCNPVIHSNAHKYHEPLAQGSDIEIITAQQPLPEGAELIGFVDVGESGLTTRCHYEYVLSCVQEEARKAGADLVQIVNHKTPDFWSTCHRISAMMYKKRIPVLEEESYWADDVIPKPDRDDAEQDSLPKAGEEVADLPEKGTGNQQTENQLTESSRPQTDNSGKPAASPYFQNIDQSGDIKPSNGNIRLVLSTGFSRRIAPMAEGIPNDLLDYLNGLRNGYHMAAEIGFQVADGIYLGPRFDRFRSSNSISVAIDNGPDGVVIGKMSESVTIDFFALALTRIYPMGNGNSHFTLNTTIGYMRYNNSGTAPFEVDTDRYALLPFSMIGANLGIRVAGTFDIGLTEKTKLSLGLGFASASIRNFDMDINGSTFKDERDIENAEGLLRLDLSAGFTWLF